MGHHTCSDCVSAGVMVLRLNVCLKYRDLIPTPHCSAPAPTFVPVYSECSTPPLVLTMPEKNTFCSFEFSCRKNFTSESWWLKHIKLNHLEQLQVASHQTVCSARWRVEPALSREFNTQYYLVQELDAFPYIAHIENIADSESEPPLTSLPQTETYAGAGAQLSD